MMNPLFFLIVALAWYGLCEFLLSWLRAEKNQPTSASFWMGLVAVSLLMAPRPVHARSYVFLNEAIREYRANPNPETESKLHAAQRKAMVMDASFWAVPVLLGIYVFIKVRAGKIINSSDGAKHAR